jgi:alkylation response protein AidB-like acyl-CoA dehydrogenase
MSIMADDLAAIDLAADDEAFRREVRAFLDETFDGDLRAQTERQAGIFAEDSVARRWHKALYERGWIAPSWPAEYGGPGWTPRQREIFAMECARAGTPALPSMGLTLCGPVIMRYGTPEQKAYFLPRMLSGEHIWCQGYSEPQSGSDLSSLQTKAVRDGDDYVVNGSKIWTTNAHNADWIFLLVRTSTEGRQQAGISFLLSPMNAPGITIRPIISTSGDHELNQLFFDNVRIPVANRMGAENEGWTVAKYLLEFERGGGSLGVGLRVAAEKVKAMAAQEPSGEAEPLLSDADFRRKLAALEIELMTADWTDLRLSSGTGVGESVGGTTASIKKLLASHKGQDVAELAVEVLGHYAVPDQRRAMGAYPQEAPIGPAYAVTPTARHLNVRASTVFGGSSEVQHNILARLLGL